MAARPLLMQCHGSFEVALRDIHPIEERGESPEGIRS